MLKNKKIAAIIPVLNEEATIPLVLNDIPKELIDEVVVIDNGSTDRTPEIVKELGATLLHESKRGYGYPCLKGIEYLKTKETDIVVFLDGNYSDYPNETIRLVESMVNEDYDLVCGSRILGNAEKGSLRFLVRYGNWLATTLMWGFYGFKYTDVGPFRAVKFDKLLTLDMHDNLGWTIEMQVKAVKCNFKIKEVPVSYRMGTGKSKFTGDLKGVLIIGYRIIRAVMLNLFYRPLKS